MKLEKARDYVLEMRLKCWTLDVQELEATIANLQIENNYLSGINTSAYNDDIRYNERRIAIAELQKKHAEKRVEDLLVLAGVTDK